MNAFVEKVFILGDRRKNEEVKLPTDMKSLREYLDVRNEAEAKRLRQELAWLNLHPRLD